MKKIITKHKLILFGGPQIITTGKEPEVLTVQYQGDDIMVWVLSEHTLKGGKIAIEIYGTGHFVEVASTTPRKFISTVQQDGLVWHIFQLLPTA